MLKSVFTVSGFTLLSRILGLVRDQLTAALLGASAVNDAFVVAQRLPNLFRSLFAEGAFSAAFVPLFAGSVAEHGRPAARRFAQEAMAVLVAILLVFTVLGEIFMPWVIRAIAPGFTQDAGKLDLAILLTRITFPYLLFISLVALLGGILNSVDRFAAVAGTPMLLNIIMIAAALGLSQWLGTGQALSWGITVAGVAQFVWLMFSCSREGLMPRLRWPRLTPAVRQLLGRVLPGVLGAGVTQLNLMISTVITSGLPNGAVSYLYYAERLNQLPLGVIGIAIGTVILPPLSRHVRRGENDLAAGLQNRGLELALFLTLPAAAALGLLAEPIIAVLFERGRFGPVETAATATALAAYSLGLPAFVAARVLAPGLLARGDTRTPVWIAIGTVLLNLVLTLLLIGPLAHVGNALATSTAGWANCLALGIVLGRRGLFSLDAPIRRRLPRILAAAAGMAGVLALVRPWLLPHVGRHLLESVLSLGGVIVLGLGVFFGLALLLRAMDPGVLRSALRRRPRSGAA